MANTKITSNVISDDIALGGNPTTTTQSAGNDTTRIATTAFVKAAIDATIDSAPGALDTLNELAAAIGDDANFSTTITNSIATKAPLANPTFTGTLTLPGGTSGTRTIKDSYTSGSIANQGFIRSSGGNYWGYGTYQEGSANWKSAVSVALERSVFAIDEDQAYWSHAPSQTVSIGSDLTTQPTKKIVFDLENTKVGIGTDSPSQTLSVNASGGANLFVSRTGQTGGLYIESDGTNGVIRNPADNPILLQVNGANTQVTINTNKAHFLRPITQGGHTGSAAGVGASIGDVNGAELGPGYLTLARDDTATAKQLQFTKNGSQHSYIDTSSAAMEIGAASGLRTRILGNGNTVFQAGSDRLFSIGSGTYTQGKIRQYVYQATISNGTTIELFGNTSAHTDIHYIMTLEAFHSGRSYRMSSGVIGGYGWNATNVGSGTNFNNATVATGRQKLTWTNGSGFNAAVYISALIFGDSGVSVYNGAISEAV